MCMCITTTNLIRTLLYKYEFHKRNPRYLPYSDSLLTSTVFESCRCGLTTWISGDFTGLLITGKGGGGSGKNICPQGNMDAVFVH